ncbi:MAG: trigger factor [Gemmatimonadales bacterium]|jgi:trigger factor
MTVPDIAITVAAKDAASRTFAVTVPPERVRRAEDEATTHLARQARMPGFRKGKVPRDVVRRRFADAIRQTALEDLVRETWQKAREQESLQPIGDPQIRNLSFEEGAPLTFELLVDVKPELALERLGGFRLGRHAHRVSEDMVEAQLLAVREQKAPWIPATERAKPGDLVEATIVNLDDASPEAPEPVRFVLGQGRGLPDLEAQLMALDPGGTWEGNIRFPDDHPDAARRGQSRRVRVTLHEVKRQDLPELTDDFAREAGAFESVAELRQAVRHDLEESAQRESDAEVRSQLVEQLAAANNVSVPPSLRDRAVLAYAKAYGVPEGQLQQFVTEMAPVVEASVRRDLILDAVAEKEKLACSEQELDTRIAELAARRNETPAAVYGALEKAGRLRELERSITEEKVFAHLLALSEVEDAPAAR